MSNLVYFSSVSENTHRFVEKLGWPAIRIPLHGRIEVDDPYVLVLPTYGAAPLLTEETRSGRLDAVLNFWTYAARLQGDNFRTVIEMDDVLKALGITPVPSAVACSPAL